MESSPVIQRKIDALVYCCDYSSALFWAERLLLLDDKDAQNVYTFLRCLHLAEQYYRVVDYVTHNKLLDRHAMFRFVTAQCLYASGRFDEMFKVLRNHFKLSEEAAEESKKPTTSTADQSTSYLDALAVRVDIESQMNRMMARAFCKIGNVKAAVVAFKATLEECVFTADAAKGLFYDHVITMKEKRETLQWLCSIVDKQKEVDPALVKMFFCLMNCSRLSHLDEPLFSTISQSPMVLFKRAELLYYVGRFNDSLRIVEKCVAQGTMDDSFYALQACILHSLAKSNSLCKFAKSLSQKAPISAVTLFVVGCYYSAEENYDLAKQFFLKASKIDPSFGYDWIAHGHACAMDTEHDQAIQCYTKASSVLPCHPLPLAFMAVEYIITTQYSQAKKLLVAALDLHADNAYASHELAVTLLQTGKYRQALESFLKTLDLVKQEDGTVPTYWEPLLCNLGTCYRKMGKYKLALEHYKLSLQLMPENPPVLLCLGFVYVRLGEHKLAMEVLHSVRCLKPNDYVAQTLFTRTMDKLHYPFAKETMEMASRMRVNNAESNNINANEVLALFNLDKDEPGCSRTAEMNSAQQRQE